MNEKELLIKAKAVIADPTKWTQGVMARDAEGRPVGFSDKKADCFCAVGAVNVAALKAHAEVTEEVTYIPAIGAIRALNRAASQRSAPFTLIEEFNDMGTTTHAAIMAVFDKAIASCESAPSAN